MRLKPVQTPIDRAEGVGEEQARLGPAANQPGGLIGRVLGDQDALVEQARGEVRDAGRAHAEMLADLHPRHGAFAAQGIEQAPAGGFARGQGQRGHGFTLFGHMNKTIPRNAGYQTKILDEWRLKPQTARIIISALEK